MLSHELYTPLTSIRAFAEILSANPELALEQRQQYSQIIVDEANRLAQRIKQVLEQTEQCAG